MLKIWFKIIKDEKILTNDVIEVEGNFSEETFRAAIGVFCEKHNQPTPVILSKHLTHFDEFNSTSFTAPEFVEKIYFDKLVLENASS